MNYSILRDSKIGNTGQILKETRENLGLKLEEVARKTGIKISYLKSLEEEKYQQIPSGLYAKKYLSKYAKFLKISPERLGLQINNEENLTETTNPFEKKILSRKQLLSFPKILRRATLALIIFLCLLYLFFYFKKMFLAPNLVIYYPEKNLITEEQTITITGKVAAEADLKINDETIPKDKQNYFSKKISLKKGINYLVIKAKKKYSQEKIIIRQILVK
ncbi:MAG: helix-turn-helix domain-containing protein [Patescibacteria group bacterium]